MRLRENVQKLERVATKELKGGKSKSLKRGKATRVRVEERKSKVGAIVDACLHPNGLGLVLWGELFLF